MYWIRPGAHVLVKGIEKGTYLGQPSISGLVSWEDCDRPTLRVHFATHAPLGDQLAEDGNAFLIGCLLPALKYRERRIAIEAPTCPWLRNNLDAVCAYYDRWFYAASRELVIEANGDMPGGASEPRTAAFFSGGVDSLHALYENHRQLPAHHAGRIRDGLVMLGFEIRVERPEAEAAFGLALRQLRPPAEALGVQLVPVLSNLRELDADGTFWGDVFQGAMLSAAAHAFGSRYSDVLLASSADIPNLSPYGTHPAVDPKLSSFGLRVHHQGERYSRLDKLRALQSWGADLSRLRVCPRAPAERLNCGACEKCIRVKLELLVLGALRAEGPFASCNVAPEDLEGLPISGGVIVFYADLIPELYRRGHEALARAVLWRVVRDMPRRMQGHLEEALKDVDHALFRDQLRHWVRRQRRGAHP